MYYAFDGTTIINLAIYIFIPACMTVIFCTLKQRFHRGWLTGMFIFTTRQIRLTLMVYGYMGALADISLRQPHHLYNAHQWLDIGLLSYSRFSLSFYCHGINLRVTLCYRSTLLLSLAIWFASLFCYPLFPCHNLSSQTIRAKYTRSRCLCMRSEGPRIMPLWPLGREFTTIFKAHTSSEYLSPEARQSERSIFVYLSTDLTVYSCSSPETR